MAGRPERRSPVEKEDDRFTCAVGRRTSRPYCRCGVFDGHPFLVEAGVSLGGEGVDEALNVHRFANRIPLLFEAGAHSGPDPKDSQPRASLLPIPGG